VLALVYFSSFSGFLTLNVDADGQVNIAGLHGFGGTSLPPGTITAATARPAFKNQWRLVIVTADGAEFQSKPATRAVVTAATASVDRLISADKTARPGRAMPPGLR
jgi:hypothetical protein